MVFDQICLPAAVYAIVSHQKAVIVSRSNTMSYSLSKERVQHVLSDIYRTWAGKTTQSLLAAIGTAVVGICVVRASLLIWAHILPSKLHIYRHSDSGSWAIVTGASDGIGKGFSEELLARGFNVLLHGRNAKKLDGVKKDLLERFPGRSVNTVVADDSKKDDSYNVVGDKVRALQGQLDILVNNVGGAPIHPQYASLDEMTHENIDTILNLNLRFATHLTSALLPVLKENAPSLIVSTGSAVGVLGFPYLVPYAGTKAYIHAFSRSLRREMATEGIRNVEVLGYLISDVASSTNTQPGLFKISSRQCAAGCLNRVGVNDDLVWRHWGHCLPVWFMQLLPVGVVTRILGDVMTERRDEEKKGS